MIRQIIALCAFLMLSGVASAGYVSAGSTGAFRTAGGSSTWTGASGSVSGGTARTMESVNVGGKYIGVPTMGPIAATAAEVLIGVVQRSPAATAIAVAPWLLQKGVELIENQWMVKGPNVQPDVGPSDKVAPIFDCWGRFSSVAECAANIPADGSYSLSCSKTACDINKGNKTGRVFCDRGADWTLNSSQTLCTYDPAPRICPTGYTPQPDGSCASPYVPTTESDWAKFRGETPPDAVLNDLCKRLQSLGSSSVGCPVTKVQTSAVTAVLSDWALNSATGVSTRQVVKLTPSPTDDDPTRMSAELVTETKTSTTTTDPVTGETTTTEKTDEKPSQDTDFCILHPESMACAKLGEPGEAPDLQNKDISASLQPDGGFGPDNGTCPADRTYTTHNGGIPIVFSWAPVCQGAITFRPVVIGMAWLSAVLIFMGITKRSAS